MPKTGSRRKAPKTGNRIKARFKAGLAHAEMTMGEWADEHGFALSHVSQVLDGKHPSKRLLAIIEEWTRQELEKIAA